MIDQEKYAKYKEIREKYIWSCVRSAWWQATHIKPPMKYVWEEVKKKYGGCEAVTCKIGSFDVRVTYDYDECYDEDWLGHFTSKWEPGAIEWGAGRNQYEYWVPCYSMEERIKDWRKRGCSKHNCWLYAIQGIREDLKEATADHSYCVITATVCLNGVEVGSMRLGGIPTEDVWDNLAECAEGQGIVDEALAQANDTVKKLKSKIDSMLELEEVM